MLPTQRTALVEMTRWSCSIIASAPPAHSALTTLCTSCWCTTMSSAVKPSGRLVGGALGVVEGDLAGPGPLTGSVPTRRRQPVGLAAHLLDGGVARAAPARSAGPPPPAGAGPTRPGAPRRRLVADHVGEVGATASRAGRCPWRSGRWWRRAAPRRRRPRERPRSSRTGRRGRAPAARRARQPGSHGVLLPRASRGCPVSQVHPLR